MEHPLRICNIMNILLNIRIACPWAGTIRAGDLKRGEAPLSKNISDIISIH
jgi:hypothetical protein